MHAVAPRKISFLAFAAANVLVDIEPAWFMLTGQHPLHRFFHTGIGAMLAAAATVALFAAALRAAKSFRLPDPLRWQSLRLGPVALGALPFDMGLGLLTAAVVNLHHFVLDGAIWKLRDGRIARVLLLADRSGEVSTAGDERLVRWLGPAVLAGGAACVAVAFVSFWEPAAGRRAEQRGDADRARVAHRCHLCGSSHRRHRAVERR